MSEKKGSFRRYRGAMPLGSLLPKVMDGCVGKRHAPLARLMAHWVEVVGREIGTYSRPLVLNIRNGEAVLHLEVDPGHATFIQHMTPQIQERASLFLGKVPVTTVKVHQSTAPIKHRLQPVFERRKKYAAIMTLPVTEIADEPLRQVLEKYGNNLLSSDVFNK